MQQNVKHFPKYRPRPWFGPDDYSEGDDPKIESEKRNKEIEEWDKEWSRRFFQRSKIKRLFIILFTDFSSEKMEMLTDLDTKKIH
jgi:hypothetical protein